MAELSICVCTYKRPILLRRLLKSISDQVDLPCSIEIIVVDNDVEQSALPVISEFSKVFNGNLKSLSLGTPNISLARNAGIAATVGEFVVMIDDDEVPSNDWIFRLVETQIKFKADIVFAPVLPEYDSGVSDWIVDGGYFDRRRFKTGTRVDHTDARSGNVLIRRSVLRIDSDISESESFPFDASFGRSGGEDTMLFRRLHSNGALMVWCDDAPVFEYVPVERACIQWLIKRSYRTGQIYLRTEMEMVNEKRRFLRGLYLGMKAFLQMIAALLISIFYFPVNRLSAFRWLRTFFSQAGKLSYFFGSKSEAYGVK